MSHQTRHLTGRRRNRQTLQNRHTVRRADIDRLTHQKEYETSIHNILGRYRERIESNEHLTKDEYYKIFRHYHRHVGESIVRSVKWTPNMTWKKYLTAIAATIGIVLAASAVAAAASYVATAPAQPGYSYVSSYSNPGIPNQPIPSTPSQPYVSSQSTQSARFHPQSATSSSASVATQPPAMTPAQIEEEVELMAFFKQSDTPQIRDEIRKGIMRREAIRSQSSTTGSFLFPGAAGSEIPKEPTEPKESKENVEKNLKEIQNERSLLIASLIELDELYQSLDVAKSEALALCNVQGLQVNQCQIDLGPIQPSQTSNIARYAIKWIKWGAEKVIGEPPAHLKPIIHLRQKIGEQLKKVDDMVQSLKGKTETKNENMRKHQVNLILKNVRHNRKYQYIFDDNNNRAIFEKHLYKSLELNDATLDSTIERINGSINRLRIEDQNEWRIKLKALHCVKEANNDNNFQDRVKILENHILKDIVADKVKEGKYSDKIIDSIEDDKDVDKMIKEAYRKNFRIEKRNLYVVNTIISKKEKNIKEQEDHLASMKKTDERYNGAKSKLEEDRVALANWKHLNLAPANEKMATAYSKMINRYPDLQKKPEQKPGPEPEQKPGPEPEQLPGPGNSARDGSSIPIPNAGAALAAAGIAAAAGLGLASKQEYNNNVEIESNEAARINELRQNITKHLRKLHIAEEIMSNKDPCNEGEKEWAVGFARTVHKINTSIVRDISELRTYINDTFTITSEKSRNDSYRMFQRIFNEFMKQSCGSVSASASTSASASSAAVESESEYDSDSEYESESESASKSERCLQKYRERYDLLHDTTLNDKVKFRKLNELNIEINKLNCRNIIRNGLAPTLVFSDIPDHRSLGKQEASSSLSSKSASSSSSSAIYRPELPTHNEWPTPNVLNDIINKSKSFPSNSSFTTPSPASNFPTKTDHNPLNNMFTSVMVAARQSKKGGRYMTRKRNPKKARSTRKRHHRRK